MLPWLKMPSDYDESPEAAYLAALLSDPDAWRYAAKLWFWCSRKHTSGHLATFPPVVLARIAGWSDDPDLFWRSLVTANLVTEDGYLSQWRELQGRVFDGHSRDRDRKRNERAAARADPTLDLRLGSGQSLGRPADVLGTSRGQRTPAPTTADTGTRGPQDGPQDVQRTSEGRPGSVRENVQETREVRSTASPTQSERTPGSGSPGAGKPAGPRRCTCGEDVDPECPVHAPDAGGFKLTPTVADTSGTRKRDRNEQITRILVAWRATVGMTKADVQDTKRRARINRWLDHPPELGKRDPEAFLVQVAVGAMLDPWISGDDPKSRPGGYRDVETVYRDVGQLERFWSLAEEAKDTPGNGAPVRIADKTSADALAAQATRSGPRPARTPPPPPPASLRGAQELQATLPPVVSTPANTDPVDPVLLDAQRKLELARARAAPLDGPRRLELPAHLAQGLKQREGK